MKEKVKSKLEELRVNYTQIKGQPFMHFYCPILFKDDDVPLCEGHIINEAFRNTSRAWTVQRKDVDGFYGSIFESDFIAFVKYLTENLSPDKVLIDKELSKKFDPKILVDDEPVDYYVTQDDIPGHFTKAKFDDEAVRLGLKLSPKAVDAVVGQNWEIEVSNDAKISSLVSLIKSAHLTLFEMMGYDYVFSNEGRFVGQKILGEFFHNNRNIKSKSKVLKNASQFFREFSNMVRPVVANSPDPRFSHQGTIIDKRGLVCKGSGDFIWARIVFIKTSEMLHSVMLPVFDHPDAVATFLSFLQNNNEIIDVKLCHFEQNQWKIDKESYESKWPK